MKRTNIEKAISRLEKRDGSGSLGDVDDMVKAYKKISHALERSVELQSHYANLLNQYDGGKRTIFKDGNAWIKRLDEIIQG